MVQFHVADADIPTVLTAEFEFITINGDEREVEIDPRTGAIIIHEDDINLVRGGSLRVAPRGQAVITPTVPRTWDGVTPLTLDFSMGDFVESPRIEFETRITNATASQVGFNGLTLDTRQFYYLIYQASRVEELARQFGLPMYAFDANPDTISRWVSDTFAVLVRRALSIPRSDLSALWTVQNLPIIYAIVAITRPDLIENEMLAPGNPALAADTTGEEECRVVNAEAIRDVPISVGRISAEDLRSGIVTNQSGNSQANTIVQLFSIPDMSTYPTPYWGVADAVDPTY